MATICSSASGEHNEHTRIHCVFFDEAQFLEEEQVWQLARVADRLDIPVMCYGLRTDFQGRCSPARRRCWPLPTSCARCARCAVAAARRPWWCGSGPDGKVARQGEQVAIGKEAYVSLCRRHWEEEMGRLPPEDFIGFAAG